MKTKHSLLTLFLLPIALAASAQQGINYKAIINDADGNILANTAITVQFKIGVEINMLGQTSFRHYYSEIHRDTSTDANGIIILTIGRGEVLMGEFHTLDWQQGYSLKTEIDIGNGFVDMGVTHFKAVPYALYAYDVRNKDDADADPANELQQLSVSGNQLTISDGNTVSLPTGGGSSSFPVYSSAEIAALTPAIGDAVYNSTEKFFQVYDGASWQVFQSNCWPQPTIADAGSHLYINDGTTSVVLSANSPEAGHGTGEWEIISGEGGSISNLADPNATFSGVLSEVYTLRWTINTSCANSFNDVKIFFEQDGGDNYLMDIDGNVYKTVWIGEQLWMAENLKATQFNDETPIPNVADVETDWLEITSPAYCWYENDSDTYSEYGALYNTFTVINGDMNVCPTGWRVPTQADWAELEIFLQNNDYNYDGTIDTDQDRTTNNKIAKALASNENWLDSDQEGVPGNTDYETYRNKSGFSALPAGRRLSSYGGYGSSIFIDLGGAAYFLISDSHLRFHISNESISSFFFDCVMVPYEGGSIRCVKD